MYSKTLSKGKQGARLFVFVVFFFCADRMEIVTGSAYMSVNNVIFGNSQIFSLTGFQSLVFQELIY